LFPCLMKRIQSRYVRFEKIKDDQNVVGELGYITDFILAESGTTTEQLFLALTLVGVVFIYIAVKMAFADPLERGGEILG
jgi:hypothetical protein